MNAKLIHNLYDDRPAPTRDNGMEDDIISVEPADAPGLEADEHSTLGLIELLLKAPLRVDALARDEGRQAELIPRFLGIVLLSFSVYALGLVLLLNYADRAALPDFLRPHWTNTFGPAFSLWAAYTLGLVAASGVCLPSFYFFGLLAGVRVSALQVTGHVMKGKASTAVMLLGILPIYVAIVLGLIVFAAPALLLQDVLYVGLALPFLAGLWGVWSIYRGFQGHADTLPECRRERRGCFLRRLTFAWAAVYSAVTPVMIYTLWLYFAGKFA
jgi:hypothetical protein